MNGDIIAIAVAATAHRRIVPFAICVECRRQADCAHTAETGHVVMALTAAQRDEVARQHREAERAELAACEKHRRF